MMWLSIAIFLLAGASAGFLGGLLGIGGGLLLVAALSFALPALGIPADEVIHVAVATSMASIVLTFISSATAHIRRGGVLWPSWRWLAPGMVIGGFIGAHLAQMLSGPALRYVIAGFCAVMAVQMAAGKRKKTVPGQEHIPRSPWLLPAGVGIGAVSSVVGIGGGSMTVPLLVALGVQPVKAVATSTVCGLAIALSSALSYMISVHAPVHPLPAGAFGYVFLPAAAATAVASMVLAPYGVRVAHRISGDALKRVFSIFLIFIGALIAFGG
ncbi:MAG: sulfite exporter TauE/SafE family protein [Thiomonas arsenitoxydans]|nr:sulfite exporter TauE/SafE family protein [Thiomonas arsenitoxydans]